jgi:hypothetical protein
VNAPYSVRLICQCLTCFFLVNLAFSAAVRLVLPLALRFADRLRARNAAQLLFLLRILPAATALFAVVALCIPSYLWFEPAAQAEQLTVFCLLMSLSGATLWTTGIHRVVAALLHSADFLRRAERCSINSDAANGLLVIESPEPVLALAGLFRPKLLVSSAVLAELTREQLDVALHHEKAHSRSGDNLKRLLVSACPVGFPSSRGFAALERSLARYMEWAADDEATGYDPLRSLCLADALVRVSKLSSEMKMERALPTAELVSTLVANDCSLSARIDRLLNRPTEPEKIAYPAAAMVGAMLLCAAAAACAVVPSSLSSIHTLLEKLLG